MNPEPKPKASSSQERAYQFIKNAILDHEFNPNQRLRAQDIAVRIELSRTPVREALSRLEQEGFVLRDGGWGYIVKSLTLKEAMDIYGVRVALEVEAVKEATPRLNEHALQQLRECLLKGEECVRQSDAKEYRLCARAFYDILARVTTNSYLEHMLSLLSDRLRWLGAMNTENNMDRPRESLAGNWEIFNALEARNVAAAEAAVRKHVAGAQESFVARIRNTGQLVAA